MAGDQSELDQVLAAVDKFEGDLGFTAPELIGMRIEQLREMVRDVFEGVDDWFEVGDADAGTLPDEPQPDIARDALEAIARAAQGHADSTGAIDHDWLVETALRGLGRMPASEDEPQPAPLPHGIALAALECIRQAYEPGTMAHDTAHKALDDTEAGRVVVRDLLTGRELSVDETTHGSRPAPELAAAMAARDEYRDNAILHVRERDEAREQLAAAKGAVNELLRMFHGISGGYGARTSVGRLNRIAREAGVEPLLPGQPLSAVLADELGVLQDSIGNLAAGLKLSASSSHPSRKSEIETSVADALLALLDPR